ncbi:hypothetical protein [Paenibacillus luteus]|uniref:hypothetical protein n=1 Tax=Paenibacillus luteus TaxID=2545753 RepID=UPI0011412D6E|nr:hypothetical protein [Paenibacillus luteus]
MEILVFFVIAFIIVRFGISVIAGVNDWSMQRKFVRHYNGKYGQGSYKRETRLARMEQEIAAKRL